MVSAFIAMVIGIQYWTADGWPIALTEKICISASCHCVQRRTTMSSNVLMHASLTWAKSHLRTFYFHFSTLNVVSMKLNVSVEDVKNTSYVHIR